MLDWHYASDGEYADLANFVCAETPGRDAAGHLQMNGVLRSQLVAQTGIRDGIQFPLPRDEHVLIGRDQHGAAAVAWWCELAGPQRVKLLVMAVSLRLRGCKIRVGSQVKTYGDLLIEEFESRLLENVDPALVRCVSAYCVIDSDNGPSQRLVQRHGYYYMAETDGHQEWWTRLDLPEV